MTTFIHPQALCESAHIGEGTRVWAFAHVLPGAVVDVLDGGGRSQARQGVARDLTACLTLRKVAAGSGAGHRWR